MLSEMQRRRCFRDPSTDSCSALLRVGCKRDAEIPGHHRAVGACPHGGRIVTEEDLGGAHDVDRNGVIDAPRHTLQARHGSRVHAMAWAAHMVQKKLGVRLEVPGGRALYYAEVGLQVIVQAALH